MRDVHDRAGALSGQARQDGPVQPDGGQKVGVEGLHPVVVGEGERPAWFGEGCPDAMHDGIQTAEDLDRLISNEIRAFGRGKIRADQPRRGPALLMTCSHDNARALGDEQFRDSRAHAACSAGNKHPLAIESFGPVLKAGRFGARWHSSFPPGMYSSFDSFLS